MQQESLRPGETLPPVRDLAESLSVNRNTVATAYQRLAQAGIAASHGRHGTTICLPPRAGEQEGISAGTTLVDLASGNPNPQWLPDPRSVLSEWQFRPHLYGEETVCPELREWSEKWFQPDCPKDFEIELTHGTTDAIERLSAAHLVPGDKVAVEDPCFLGTINAVRLTGMQAIGVDIDELGMRPESLEQALAKGAKAVLITPRAHNPTGASLTKRRADALKRILAKHPSILVILDDHFAMLTETPLYSVIPNGTARWAVIRSVSKWYGPDLRLAFVACDSETATRLRSRLAPGMSWVSHILQDFVTACLRSAEVQELLARAKQGYTRRRDELCEALDARAIVVSPPTDGLNVWVPLEKDGKDVAYNLAKRGWLVRIGNAFDVQGQTQAIRVTVSQLQDGQSVLFAADLKSCLAN